MNPYLIMDGNAKEAIQFYEKALDAQMVMVQTFGEMPANPDFPSRRAGDNMSYLL